MPADSLAVAIPVGDNYRPGYAQRRAQQDSGIRNPTSYRSMRGSLAAQGNRIDDTGLIREAQQGNRAAFEVLVRHYDQSVLCENGMFGKKTRRSRWIHRAKSTAGLSSSRMRVLGRILSGI